MMSMLAVSERVIVRALPDRMGPTYPRRLADEQHWSVLRLDM